MRALLALAIFSAIATAGKPSEKHELPIDSQLPKISDEWVRRDDDGTRGDHSWVNFDNKEQPGDVLAFVMTKVPPTAKVTNSAAGQASIETFLDNGLAFWTPKRTGRTTSSEILRHRIVLINIGTAAAKHEIEAIEYTYIYDEPESQSPTAMGHGYGVVIGGDLLFVQHTSPRPIRSEVAFDMVAGVLSRHLQLAGKPHGYSKGKILKTNG